MIFAGHYELLIIGGYLYKSGSITPFLGSLIHILGSLHMNTSCYFLSLYKEVDAKYMALKIMTPGLKQEVVSQQQAIVKKAKEEL